MHSSKTVASLKFSVIKISVVEEGSKIYETISEKLQQNPDGHSKCNYFSHFDPGPEINFVGFFVCLFVLWLGFFCLFCFPFFIRVLFSI